MKTPEKLYLHLTKKGEVSASWLTFPLTNEDIEYTRTDTFIEKASEWLRYNNDLIDGDVADYVEDFVNYMKAKGE